MLLSLLILCYLLLLLATCADSLFFGGLGSLGSCSCPPMPACGGGLPSLPTPCQIFSCPPQIPSSSGSCGAAAPSYQASYSALPAAPQPPAYQPAYQPQPVAPVPQPPASSYQYNQPASQYPSFSSFSNQPLAPAYPAANGYSTSQYANSQTQPEALKLPPLIGNSFSGPGPSPPAPSSNSYTASNSQALQQPVQSSRPAAPSYSMPTLVSPSSYKASQPVAPPSYPAPTVVSPSSYKASQPASYYQPETTNTNTNVNTNTNYAASSSSSSSSSSDSSISSNSYNIQSSANQIEVQPYAPESSPTSHQASHQVAEEQTQIANNIENQLATEAPTASNSYPLPKTDFKITSMQVAGNNNYAQAQTAVNTESERQPTENTALQVTEKTEYVDSVTEIYGTSLLPSQQVAAAGPTEGATTAAPSYYTTVVPATVNTIPIAAVGPKSEVEEFTNQVNNFYKNNGAETTTAQATEVEVEVEEGEDSSGYGRKAYDVKSANNLDAESIKRESNRNVSIDVKREDENAQIEEYEAELDPAVSDEFEKTKAKTMKSLHHLDFQKPKDSAISKCNSGKLMQLMHEKMTPSPSISKQLIFTAATKEFPGRSIDVICSRHSFSYIVVTSPLYCEHRKSPLTCFAFFQP
ncbi:hypothetical protein WR25_00831 [Diploscapter pachys]|uniref:Ground-like domain-containing protein n=1 Tax=Diploscapter pachys TaxID=2018661 RepID=A0A2A2JVE2_9BILA|nr:hypothetical protein WR25_00831 [Diploscapter pachys]